MDILRYLKEAMKRMDIKPAHEEIETLTEIHMPAKEHERIAANKDYLIKCHNDVFYVQATQYLNRVGLYLYIDRLQIGYDSNSREIILPLYNLKYHAIKLNYDHAADKEAEMAVLRHYNLKLNKAGECYLVRDETGKITGSVYNNDKPYRTESEYAELNNRLNDIAPSFLQAKLNK